MPLVGFGGLRREDDFDAGPADGGDQARAVPPGEPPKRELLQSQRQGQTPVTENPMTSHDDVELLLWDLARISGTLSEIATVWRSALPYRPELPLTRCPYLGGLVSDNVFDESA